MTTEKKPTEKKPVVIQAQPATVGVSAMPAKASGVGSVIATGAAVGEAPPVVPSVKKVATPVESFELLWWRRRDDDSRWEYRRSGRTASGWDLASTRNRLKALIGALKSIPPPET